MKRVVMWIIAAISFIISAIALYFMPNAIPLHYGLTLHFGLNTATPRWGSKYETLIFPVIMLLMALSSTLSAKYYEKKAQKAAIDRESAYNKTNAKALETIGVAIMALLTVMQGVLLYGAYSEALTGASRQLPGLPKIPFILLGVISIVLGNFMTKTRNNGTFGVRIKWSRYNDNTWRKSNRFGALSIIITGVLTIIIALFCKNPELTIIVVLGLFILALIAILIYAHRVYSDEIAAEKGGK